MVTIEKFETYPKQTYRNRCEIYTEKGKTPLVVPVSKPNGNHTILADIQIFNQDKWFIKHWRAIETAYKAAPYFLYYSDEIKPFFNGSFESLLGLNVALTNHFLGLLGIEKNLTLSNDYIKFPETLTDFRATLSPKRDFQLEDVPEYTQVFELKHGFIPNLSVIDLIFNLGPESSDYLSRFGGQLQLKNHS